MSTTRLLPSALLCLALVSCASVPRPDAGATGLETRVLDRLYFGRAMPDGATVDEAQWRAFLAEAVTPRFPDGLTVWRAEGQWRDASGRIVREESFLLEIVHPDGAVHDASIAAIVEEYKRHFRQESVLQVRSSVLVGF